MSPLDELEPELPPETVIPPLVVVVVVPELVPVPSAGSTAPPAAKTAPLKSSASIAFDCSRDCQDGCRQPDNCLRAEAQQQVQSLLDSMSLDAMIDLATDSLEERTRSRLDQTLGG